MDFSDAVIFLAAVIVIVGAGVLLGIALQRQRMSTHDFSADSFEAYLDVLLAADELRGSTDEQKHTFIHAYYSALLVAPDSVLIHLNRYLRLVTASEYDEQAALDERDRVALAMRRHTQSGFNNKTRATADEMMSIEIGKPGQVVSSPQFTAAPIASVAADPYQPTDYA